MARGGELFPFPGGWVLGFIQPHSGQGLGPQLHAEPSCSLPSPPPVLVSPGSHSWAGQARPTFWGPPCSQGALETASGRGAVTLCDPCADVREDPRGSQLPPPTAQSTPSPGWLCRLSVHISCPGEVCPSSGGAPLPLPNLHHLELPCLAPDKKEGEHLHGTYPSPGEPGPRACGRAPGAECPGPPSRVLSSGSSLDTTE